MKKLTLLLTTLLLLSQACNKIDTTQELFRTIGEVEVTPYDPEYAKTVIQKIYVEEFTGHRCVYCPAGARELKDIMAEDPAIILTAIHCSSLADPLSTPPFDRNYKTPMGNIIEYDFNIKGLPKATINRMEVKTNEWGFDRNKWRSVIAGIDRKNVKAGIQLQCHVDEGTQEIAASVAVTIIKDLPNPVQICLVLQQDAFISGQVDNGVPIPDYEHNHVLRAGLNGNYGTKLTPNGLVNTHYKYATTCKIAYGNSFPYSNLPIEISNCSIVAYLIDMVTKEVVQVEQFEL
ncbi:MAG: Omp28-related outer membrane protein [Lentimicrobiaceae bacterium]|nr:Omp28-related outer membrane protein [Lentimicrobiaceae bacterium]